MAASIVAVSTSGKKDDRKPHTHSHVSAYDKWNTGVRVFMGDLLGQKRRDC